MSGPDLGQEFDTALRSTLLPLVLYNDAPHAELPQRRAAVEVALERGHVDMRELVARVAGDVEPEGEAAWTPTRNGLTAFEHTWLAIADPLSNMNASPVRGALALMTDPHIWDGPLGVKYRAMSSIVRDTCPVKKIGAFAMKPADR